MDICLLSTFFQKKFKNEEGKKKENLLEENYTTITIFNDIRLIFLFQNFEEKSKHCKSYSGLTKAIVSLYIRQTMILVGIVIKIWFYNLSFLYTQNISIFNVLNQYSFAIFTLTIIFSISKILLSILTPIKNNKALKLY